MAPLLRVFGRMQSSLSLSLTPFRC
ncbi:hypothetical protein WG66_004161 [Moniliophthora roreri]|nr:hypothetical protein WG66_004161 [Moniliophthora roreri]